MRVVFLIVVLLILVSLVFLVMRGHDSPTTGAHPGGSDAGDRVAPPAQGSASPPSGASVPLASQPGSSWLDLPPPASTAPVPQLVPGSPAWRAAVPPPVPFVPSDPGRWNDVVRFDFADPDHVAGLRELSSTGEEALGTGGAFRVIDGRLRIDSADGLHAMASPMDDSGDVRLSFDLTLDPPSDGNAEPGDLTVFWGSRGTFKNSTQPISQAWNGYEAKVGGIGRTEQKIKRKGSLVLAEGATPGLQDGGTHRIEVEQRGGLVTLRIDGQPTVQVLDDEPLPPGAGARCGFLSHHMRGWIDNWTVERPAPVANN